VKTQNVIVVYSSSREVTQSQTWQNCVWTWIFTYGCCVLYNSSL